MFRLLQPLEKSRRLVTVVSRLGSERKQANTQRRCVASHAYLRPTGYSVRCAWRGSRNIQTARSHLAPWALVVSAELVALRVVQATLSSLPPAGCYSTPQFLLSCSPNASVFLCKSSTLTIPRTRVANTRSLSSRPKGLHRIGIQHGCAAGSADDRI